MAQFSNSPGASSRLEQKADAHSKEKPNFLLIVVLASLVLILLLIAAGFFLKWDGRHLMLKPTKQPASMTQLAISRLYELA